MAEAVDMNKQTCGTCGHAVPIGRREGKPLAAVQCPIRHGEVFAVGYAGCRDWRPKDGGSHEA